MTEMEDRDFFGKEKIGRILMKIAPPVMLAQLIQALYNIVDSLFVGRYSGSGLTALSIIYPVQLLMIALAVGTGVGINTCIAHYLGLSDDKRAEETAGVGLPLALAMWVIFAAACYAFMPQYAHLSTTSQEVAEDVISYGRIVCVLSVGLFTESIWTKILQAHGDMKTPMLAQIVGALINIVFDPLLIFGLFGCPRLGVSGAAIATVLGQMAAAAIVGVRVHRRLLCHLPDLGAYPRTLARIYRLGLPNILMQSAYTFYIFGLNMILEGFSDDAVTALGLYYKWQTFFFIPLGALQTCIVPILSYNYAAGNVRRCRRTLGVSLIYGFALMLVGTLCFELIPSPMLRVFTDSESVVEIGTWGFRIIGVSFIPMVTSLIFPVFFQAVGSAAKSSMLTLVRTVVLFVPLGYLFARMGLHSFWLTFPVTEVVTSIVGLMCYRAFLRGIKKNPMAVYHAAVTGK